MVDDALAERITHTLKFMGCTDNEAVQITNTLWPLISEALEDARVEGHQAGEDNFTVYARERNERV
jgi:hypothetical protein